jgi:hypothetical protein
VPDIGRVRVEAHDVPRSMLIQCRQGVYPGSGKCSKNSAIVPGGWNRVRLPSGDLTKPPVLFDWQAGSL